MSALNVDAFRSAELQRTFLTWGMGPGDLVSVIEQGARCTIEAAKGADIVRSISGYKMIGTSYSARNSPAGLFGVFTSGLGGWTVGKVSGNEED